MMKRVFALVGVCLLAFTAVVSIAATNQGLTLRAIPKPGFGTTVEFNLPKASEVNLSIYDITGKKVKDLVQDRYLEAGEHSYAWDGRNEQGEQVGSGIYFARLRAGKKYTGLKLTYIARGVVVSSGVSAPEITDEIREEHIIFPLKLAKLSPDEQGALLGRSCESFENVKQLARYIAKAFPRIETALRNAIQHSSDDIDHKVNLPSFVLKATTGDGRPISTVLCEANGISRLELRSVVDLIDPIPYIWIPPECKEWTKEEAPVIALSPAGRGAKAVWACNTEGEEILLSLEEPPASPTVVITAEPPLNKTSYFKETNNFKETKGIKRPIYYHLHVDTLRYWKKRWDPWPCSAWPEIYTLLYVQNDQGQTYKIGPTGGWSPDYNGNKVKKACGDNSGSDNCNCADKPVDGEHGYYYGSPGKTVGKTSSAYPKFLELEFWDDGHGWCDPWDELMEDIPLNTACPCTTWYYGKKGSCKNVDTFLHPTGY